MNVVIEEIMNPLNVSIANNVNVLNLKIEELGVQGLSAYDIAVQNGFVGTQIEWSNSLKIIKFIDLTELP